MEQPTKRGRGRPPKLGETKRAFFQTRIHGSLRKRLEEDAADNGRSLSEEIEHRLHASYTKVEDLFGGAAGLNMAIMLYANFRFAGGEHAVMKGHPEWTPAEWLADRDCFERALAALVRGVWEHNPGPVTRKDFRAWLEEMHRRDLNRELNEQWMAEREAEAAAAEAAEAEQRKSG